MTALLEFDHVTYSYKNAGKEQVILDTINFTFEKGKFYSILGPSGSGKSTALSLASALDVPNEGNILYNGKSIRQIGLEKYRNRHIAIVFQAYNLIPYMTAIQNVITAIDIRKAKIPNKKQYAIELLQKVGLGEEEANRNVLKLSGGQQQRVAIARALSCDVDIIFADEPTGNLDEKTAKEIIAILKELAHDAGKCIIVVTHSNQVANESDVVIRLKNKRFEVVKEIRHPIETLR